MTNELDHGDFHPSVESIRTRLAATAPWDNPEGATRPSAVSVLLNMMEQRDRQAAEHAFRVAELSTRVAVEVGMNPVGIARLRLAALLHDVGKLSVPEEVLLKTEPLSEEEWTRIKFHPEYGFQMIASSVHPEVAEAVLKHCERIDGSGYPNAVPGDEIPLNSKVLLVADVFDAMVSPKPYRPAMSVQEAMEQIRAGAGTTFSQQVADGLRQVIGRRKAA
ncbi:MAG: HD-GYP domain-containing protein [Acidimicrobiia bacterium]|nr:HD-GYP domain-containing protein [Acidimicrobiia bacterium]NNL28773.1 HD-GYP domain-containing protein [Acidimicrobiia bacterium]NNL47534.1 HD-GYP domain-containing protein [Acidimicrobiia bacterium]